MRSTRNRAAHANRTMVQMQNRIRMQAAVVRALSSFNRLAFEYDPTIDYSTHPKIIIGDMVHECTYCHALKFKNEIPGMCYAAFKVVLPPLHPPPEPLRSLILGQNEESKLFLKKIRSFNFCFQTTSFAANIISNTDARGRTFDLTFKIQSQIYHQIGSLLPMPDASPKFLQIYFLGDEEDQVNIRCEKNRIERIQERQIVSNLETFFANNNQLIQLFKQVSNSL